MHHTKTPNRLFSEEPRDGDHMPVAAQPFLKWVGGKRHLLRALLPRLPSSFGVYWEPFVGAGALFFAIAKSVADARLSDSNDDLVNAYTMVRDHPRELVENLERHAVAHSKQYYLEVRKQPVADMTAIEQAARFLYLTKASFNGLYRVNRNGDFNAPFGDRTADDIADDTHILVASQALRNTAVAACDFSAIHPGSGDLVYCDPPHDGQFSRYTAAGFGTTDQERLAEKARQWTEQKIHVMMSNTDSPLIRKLYDGWCVSEVTRPNLVNSDLGGRGPTVELILTNYDHGATTIAKWEQPQLEMAC